jgi:hypothetical protein
MWRGDGGSRRCRKSQLVRCVAWLGLLMHILCLHRHVVISKALACGLCPLPMLARSYGYK